jgi:hypothetical protein
MSIFEATIKIRFDIVGTEWALSRAAQINNDMVGCFQSNEVIILTAETIGVKNVSNSGM